MSDNVCFVLVMRVPKLRLDEFAVSLGGVQLHGTVVVLVGPLKLKTALAGQLVCGTVIFTCIVCPDSSNPFVGKNVMPDTPLLDADQYKVLCALRLLNVAGHIQP
jgi:hypothetical protein